MTNYSDALARLDDPTGGVLTSGHVAALFGVDPKTVTRWAREGKLPCFRTIGRQRRFRAADVRDLLAPWGMS